MRSHVRQTFVREAPKSITDDRFPERRLPRSGLPTALSLDPLEFELNCEVLSGILASYAQGNPYSVVVRCYSVWFYLSFHVRVHVENNQPAFSFCAQDILWFHCCRKCASGSRERKAVVCFSYASPYFATKNICPASFAPITAIH